jgi:hypothetical protein
MDGDEVRFIEDNGTEFGITRESDLSGPSLCPVATGRKYDPVSAIRLTATGSTQLISAEKSSLGER